MKAIDDAAIVDAVRRVRPDVQAIYRFGSTVTGYARDDSDVDVAVLLATPLQGGELLDLIGAVTTAADRDADIMELRRASTIAHFEVLNDGILIDDDGTPTAPLFEVRALKAYQDLKHWREPIERDIVRRGHVHA